jgi:hypothetical protein
MLRSEEQGGMERDDELEGQRRAADDAVSANVPPEMAPGSELDRPGVHAGDVVDGVFTAIVGVDVMSDLVKALPKVASDGMEVIGNIGEALGDVLDFDF